MLPPKQGICSECNDGIVKPIIKGLCISKHYWSFVKKRSLEKQKLKQSTLTGKVNVNKGKKNIIEPSEDELTKYTKGGGALWRWFEERRGEMTGKCAHCGGSTPVGSDKYFHFSIAHLLPKVYFKSVSTHPDNWLELCSWGNNCHGNFDSYTLDLTELNCFDSAIVKFQKIYPHIAQKEKRRIPEVLLQYLKTDF